MDPWPSYQQRVRRLLTLFLVAIAALALGAWRWPSLIALGIVLLTVVVIAVTNVGFLRHGAPEEKSSVQASKGARFKTPNPTSAPV
jgi:fatty acid desaturase